MTRFFLHPLLQMLQHLHRPHPLSFLLLSHRLRCRLLLHCLPFRHCFLLSSCLLHSLLLLRPVHSYHWMLCCYVFTSSETFSSVAKRIIHFAVYKQKIPQYDDTLHFLNNTLINCLLNKFKNSKNLLLMYIQILFVHP